MALVYNGMLKITDSRFSDKIQTPQFTIKIDTIEIQLGRHLDVNCVWRRCAFE